MFNKVLVKEFYRSHLTFFLLVGGLVGGFMRSEDHLALAEIVVSSPLFLCLPFLCWVLYAIIISRFNAQHMALSHHEFLFSLLLVKPIQQYFILLVAVLAELAPILLYSVLLFYTSWRDGEGLSAWLLFLSLVAIVIFVTVRLRLTFFGRVHRVVFLQFRFTRYLKKPHFLFFIDWISRKDLVQLAFTKIFTILLLLATSYLYTTDAYDMRLFLISVAIVGCVHGQLIWQLHRFDNYHMAFTRNLPISIWQRQMSMLATSTVLLLPELGLIVSNYSKHATVGTTLVFCAFMLSVAVLFYGVLFRKEREQEQLVPLIFFLCMGFIVLILYKVSSIVFIICNSTIGFYFLHTRYYLFEYSTEKKKHHSDS